MQAGVEQRQLNNFPNSRMRLAVIGPAPLPVGKCIHLFQVKCQAGTNCKISCSVHKDIAGQFRNLEVEAGRSRLITGIDDLYTHGVEPGCCRCEVVIVESGSGNQVAGRHRIHIPLI